MPTVNQLVRKGRKAEQTKRITGNVSFHPARLWINRLNFKVGITAQQTFPVHS